MTNRRVEVILLLRDYMNFLPPGPQEAYVPVGMGISNEADWPLTSESIKRLDRTTLVGDTYYKLDQALRRLDREHPKLYTAMLDIYLREESGHRDLDHIKRVAKAGLPDAIDLLARHDAAVEQLVEYLEHVDLYVRYPHKATGPKPGQNMEDKHDELFAIFMRAFDDDDIPYRQALNYAVFKMDDYYSKRHADRIIKGKLRENE
jgi:hypothetical protein